MKMIKILLCLFCLIPHLVHAAQGKEISYDIGKQNYKAYLAMPNGSGPFPAVLIIHEWWGLGDYPRMRADQLAQLGFAAMAMDMYGDGKTAQNPKDAAALAKAALSDWNNAHTRVEHALKVLREQSSVDSKKVAIIGYCFGGGVALNSAREGTEVSGVVSFHGSLIPKTSKRDFKTQILVLNGEADPLVTKEEIANFKSEMKKNEVKYEFVNYPDALHAFTNPMATKVGKEFNMPVAYNQKADKASWEKMLTFLKKIFAS